MRTFSWLLLIVFASTPASNRANATPPPSNAGPGEAIAELRDEIDPAEGERSLLRPESEALAAEMNRLHREKASDKASDKASEGPQLHPAVEPQAWEDPRLVQPAEFSVGQPAQAQPTSWGQGPSYPPPPWGHSQADKPNPKRLLLESAHELEKLAHRLELESLTNEADKLRRVAGELRQRGRKMGRKRQQVSDPGPPPIPGQPFFPGQKPQRQQK